MNKRVKMMLEVVERNAKKDYSETIDRAIARCSGDLFSYSESLDLISGLSHDFQSMDKDEVEKIALSVFSELIYIVDGMEGRSLYNLDELDFDIYADK